MWFSVSLIKHHGDRATHVAAAAELLLDGGEGERRERTMLEFKMNHVVTKSVAAELEKVFHLNRVHNAGGRANLWHFQFLLRRGET